MIEMSFEESLNKFGFLYYGFKGTSMNPLLVSGRDTVHIVKTNKRFKKGDIALYKRRSGEFVLHRVMKVLKGSYVFCGDNHFVLEYGITDEQILGVCIGYYKKNKYVDVKKSFKYKLYLIFWGKCLFFRRILYPFKTLWHKLSGR